MLYKLGRLLQLVAMILLPLGIAGNLARQDEYGTGWTLGMLGLGVVVFFTGYLLQQAGRKV